MASLEREIDRLYGLPLEEFTGARNELAKRLKFAGEGEAPAQVRELPKPPIAAWAVNQLARSEKKEIAALLRAGGRLREAQARALERRAGDALRKAQREENEIVQRLVERAKDILGRPSDQTLERIRDTLKAAATSDDREELRAGRLTESLSTMGFDALAELDFAATDQAGPPEERRRAKEAEQKRREVEQQAARLAAEATEAKEEATRAEAAAVAARRAADEAGKLAARAEAELRAESD